MAKTHRGKGPREIPNNARGKCPNCGRTGIKLMYEVGEDDKKQMVCKECNVALKKKKAAEKPSPSVEQKAAPVEEAAPASSEIAPKKEETPAPESAN